MKTLLIKESNLSTPVFAWFFLFFTLMTFIPGYPILCGVLFICLGIFQSYQYAREANDIVYTLLLPIRKRDAVRAKYLFACLFEGAAMLFFAIFTVIRMAFLSDVPVYEQNVLMAANPVFLAFVLLIFALFNCIFIGGFFRTAYVCGKPFIIFLIICLLVIGVAETLHHIPGLGFLNETGARALLPQILIFAAAMLFFAAVTFASCRISEKRFDSLDF